MLKHFLLNYLKVIYSQYNIIKMVVGLEYLKLELLGQEYRYLV